MLDPSDIPPWLNQRRYGQPLVARTLVPMNNPAQGGEPTSVGTWPADDTNHLWPHVPNHHKLWGLVLVFTGRVLTRFSRRVCPDGTLVSREVPRFTDIDTAVSLVRQADQMRWT
eukprot:324731-Pyramimonas_sp.AAC.1